jgi:hypothetical protein
MITQDSSMNKITEFPPPDARLSGKVRQIRLEPKQQTNGNGSHVHDDWLKSSHDGADAKAAPLPLIDVLQLEGVQIPERQWLVPMRIPARNVTLLSGDGGVGKSILTLQLAVAARLGRDWLGSLVSEPGPVIVFCAEDDIDEIHRRIALIAEHYHVTFAQLAGLYILPMAGQDALMAVPNRSGVIEPTKLYGQPSRGWTRLVVVV